jgi:outer membrane protein assembly factor BamB
MQGDVRHVAASPDGTALVAGWFQVPEVSSGHFALAKVGDDGEVLWAQSGSANATVAVAADGWIIAAGNESGAVILDEGGPNEITIGESAGQVTWLAKYSADGELVWAHDVAAEGLYGQVWSAAIHADGRFAVSGNAGNDSVVVAFDQDGGPLWSRLGDTSAPYPVESRVLAAADGSYFVGGIHWRKLELADGTDEPIELQAPVLGDPPQIEAGSFFLARYGDSGDLLWATSADNPDVYNNAAAWSQSIALLPEDGILIAGFLYGQATFGLGEPKETTLVGHEIAGPATHSFVARYGIDGQLEWAIALDPGAMMFEIGAVAAAADGSKLISGSFEGSAEFDLELSGTTTVDALGDDDLFLIDICP